MTSVDLETPLGKIEWRTEEMEMARSQQKKGGRVETLRSRGTWDSRAFLFIYFSGVERGNCLRGVDEVSILTNSKEKKETQDCQNPPGGEKKKKKKRGGGEKRLSSFRFT